jgi:hypothetical protein
VLLERLRQQPEAASAQCDVLNVGPDGPRASFAVRGGRPWPGSERRTLARRSAGRGTPRTDGSRRRSPVRSAGSRGGCWRDAAALGLTTRSAICHPSRGPAGQRRGAVRSLFDRPRLRPNVACASPRRSGSRAGRRRQPGGTINAVSPGRDRVDILTSV